MTYKLQSLLAAALFTMGAAGVNAQTVSTLDDLTLPGANTDYATSLPSAQQYVFTSGRVTFHGVLESWGGYGQFNYSNVVDTITSGFGNDKAAMTGIGYNNSANYGVAYAPADWPTHPDQSLLIGARIEGNTNASRAVGMYVTNTTYAYRYIQDNYRDGDWYKLIVRGYRNHVQVTDSATYTLASYTATDTVLRKTWEWMDLTALGNVDSLSFQVVSSDEFTPFYFAFDNFTVDSICPEPKNLAATSVNENSATITWISGLTGVTPDYEIAVDQSATLAPTATTVTVTAPTYSKTGLSSNTLYYVHVRAACGSGAFSNWDTASFKTLPGTGIFNAQPNTLQLSLSPNPATHVINLNSDMALDATVYSIEGKVLLTATRTRQIDISTLPAGLYLLKATDAAGTGRQATLRFTKQN
ncbi:DUF4465 domain-containing protein [Taibaiella koreensis]|uniref:DUF4465 domain-containing protein n=1 Tax=Taibaiella koreensis TaxID=1268548 RepID=UPI000E59D8AC|nr:DUF4465 domain-containing protein [Taibaiella koreensis]